MVIYISSKTVSQIVKLFTFCLMADSMRHLEAMKRILILLFVLLCCSSVHAGRRCTGSAFCSACTTCSGCKHCAKGGGTCGVCSGTSNGANSGSSSSDSGAYGSDYSANTYLPPEAYYTPEQQESIKAKQEALDQQESEAYRRQLQESEKALRRPSAADVERIVREQQAKQTPLPAAKALSTRKTKKHANSKSFRGKCVGVSDGDTITVMDGCCEEKVRLHGIDAPEKKQAFGNQAKKFTSNLAFGRQVTVYPTDTDRYGRTVAWVFVGKQCINAELVKAGYAWHYKQYAPNEAKLAAYENEARKVKHGLWSDAHAVAPWDFRRGKTAQPVAKIEPVASTHSVVEKNTQSDHHSTIVAVALIGAGLIGATLVRRRRKG
jgi:endonuclease YncB( thermonuclease family)